MYDKFQIESRAVQPYFKNGYVLSCVQTGEATFIDPGDEAPQLLDWIEEKELRLTSITLTHAHMDHICGVGAVKEVWDVPIFLHPDDLFLYDRLEEQSRMFGMNYPPAPPVDQEIAEGDLLSVGDLRLSTLHTPGHSPGSVSLVLDDHVFCGDVIFAGSIGRTDLPGGSLEILMSSIRDKILPLGDDRHLLSGHGPGTTVGRERVTNPFLQ